MFGSRFAELITATAVTKDKAPIIPVMGTSPLHRMSIPERAEEPTTVST
jgi:hypothetical protein